jgi:hypothetical protein
VYEEREVGEDIGKEAEDGLGKEEDDAPVIAPIVLFEE